MVLSILGILISLAFLITMAYRGHSVLYIAPIAATIAVLFSGMPVIASYTQIFMPAMAGFIGQYFPLFLTGAILGTLMTITGFARSMAVWLSQLFGSGRAIFVTVLSTSLLIYGGVSAWVVVFTIFPVATALFKESDIPRRLMPAAIGLGIFTFSLASVPGSPQIHNTMPTSYFGTNTFAAPILSLLTAALVFSLGMAWLNRRSKKLRADGESFSDTTVLEQRVAAKSDSSHSSLSRSGSQVATDRQVTESDGAAGLSKAKVAIRGIQGMMPILIVAAVNALGTYVVIPAMNTDYLAQEEFGSTDVSSVAGVWSVTLALFAGIVYIFIVRFRDLPELIKSLSEGAQRAVLPVSITASEIGYGAVITTLAAFAIIRDGLFSLTDNALVTGVLATAGISGITGSASGGLGISLRTFGDELATAAVEQGIDPELMHRLIAMSSTSFDSLPHNGAMITMLVVCGLTHRESYKDIFVVTVLVPVIGIIFAGSLGLAFGAF